MSDAPKQPVGMIGLGIMGSAMSGNLIAAGYPVVGYDIAAPALAALAERGGVAAKSVSEGAARGAILVTSLPSPQARHDLARAPGGQAPGKWRAGGDQHVCARRQARRRRSATRGEPRDA